jgi:outer membrane protein assembly factor BamA
VGRKRKYFRPTTLAFRGLHFGRYGRDADNIQKITPIYLGDEQLIRGYPYQFEYNSNECQGTDLSRCSIVERLYGSRIAVFNAEFRVPFFGTRGFGLINFPYLPLELSAFFDGGLAWTANQRPELRWDSDPVGAPTACQDDFACAVRTPVFSTGLSGRFNILGYLILESYIAKPFQRPNRAKEWVWGFNIAPGW